MDLLEFIKQNDNWEELLTEKRIKIRREGILALFKYGVKADFSDDIVKQCRGHIINLDNMEYVCRPFLKFFNYYEAEAADIDWKTAQIQEKIDGSIVKLWFYDGVWRWSSNSVIYAQDCYLHNGEFSMSWLIRDAENYKDIPFDNLDKGCTYIFELVSPYNRIVINYPKTYLYHTGTINNSTGQEYIVDIGIEHPKTYKIANRSLESVLQKAKEFDTLREGFVVCDGSFNRIKIKTEEYLRLHYSMTNKLSEKQALETLQANDEEALYAIKSNIELAPDMLYYEYKYAVLKKEISHYISYAMTLYQQVDRDRKTFAQSLEDSPYKMFAFKAIDNPAIGVSERLKDIKISHLKKLIDNIEQRYCGVVLRAVTSQSKNFT